MQEQAIKKHPGHPDVPRPSDAELVEFARGICHAIEACGASPELTHAVTLASDLVWYLQKPQPAIIGECVSAIADEAREDDRNLYRATDLVSSAVHLLKGSEGAPAAIRSRAERLADSFMAKVEQLVAGNRSSADCSDDGACEHAANVLSAAAAPAIPLLDEVIHERV